MEVAGGCTAVARSHAVLLLPFYQDLEEQFCAAAVEFHVARIVAGEPPYRPPRHIVRALQPTLRTPAPGPTT